jgi:hypothetical protein
MTMVLLVSKREDDTKYLPNKGWDIQSIISKLRVGGSLAFTLLINGVMCVGQPT